MVAVLYPVADSPRFLSEPEKEALTICHCHVAGGTYLAADCQPVAALLGIPVRWLAFLEGDANYVAYGREEMIDEDFVPALGQENEAVNVALRQLRPASLKNAPALRGPVLLIHLIPTPTPALTQYEPPHHSPQELHGRRRGRRR